MRDAQIVLSDRAVLVESVEADGAATRLGAGQKDVGGSLDGDALDTVCRQRQASRSQLHSRKHEQHTLHKLSADAPISVAPKDSHAGRSDAVLVPRAVLAASRAHRLRCRAIKIEHTNLPIAGAAEQPPVTRVRREFGTEDCRVGWDTAGRTHCCGNAPCE